MVKRGPKWLLVEIGSEEYAMCTCDNPKFPFYTNIIKSIEARPVTFKEISGEWMHMGLCNSSISKLYDIRVHFLNNNISSQKSQDYIYDS